MSNFTPLDEQYPNQFLGVGAVSDTNAGAVNSIESPLFLATAAGVTGAILNSGSGSPGLTGATNRIGGNVGDIYFRTGGQTATTAIYHCSRAGVGTTGGATGAAVWTELV